MDFSWLKDELPPILTRPVIGEKLAHIISPRYLANLDCLDKGPPRFRIGRRIGYPRDEFLVWLFGWMDG